MSVIYYEKDEILRMAASSWHYGSIGSLDGQRRMERMAEAVNRIAKGNAEAYAATYREETEAITVTAREIKSAIVGKTVSDMQRGYHTLRGVRYNLIANNGEDFASAEILDDLTTMLYAHLDRAMMNRS